MIVVNFHVLRSEEVVEERTHDHGVNVEDDDERGKAFNLVNHAAFSTHIVSENVDTDDVQAEDCVQVAN